MEKKRKVLVIKTGYSEILDEENNSRKVSMGDVLRTTVLLNVFKDDEVTWVTDKDAFPLLEKNLYIKRLLPYDFTTVLQIESEEFDVVINLEKVPGICAWTDKIKAWKKIGFRLDSKTGKAEAYDKAFEVLAVSSDSEARKLNKRTAQELLFEMVGHKWNNEEYILGYKPRTTEVFDVALNTQVGQKWPTKSWSSKNWDELERILKKEGLKVSRQDKENPEILTNLNLYADWINSCKITVTNDSLGMHLGIALKKKVLGLFGATPDKEVSFYNRGKAILPEKYFECSPCSSSKCKKESFCMDFITPEMVFEEIKSLLSESSKPTSPKRDLSEKGKSSIAVDNHKLIYHPERVAEWQKAGDCFPIYVEFGLTNFCNHRCIFCALDFLEKGSKFIDTEIMTKALKEIAACGVKSVMFAGEGESVLHKDIGLFTKIAKEAGMDVSITTNGVPFVKEKIEACLPNLSWIRFSVDSGSPENYALVHGCQKEDFERLMSNIKETVEFKKKYNLKTTIGVQFLMTPQNMKEAAKLAERVRDIGVDNLQVKPYSHHPKSKNNLVVDPEEYDALEESLKKFNTDSFKVIFRKSTIERLQDRPYKQCLGASFIALVDARGNILPCNLFYDNPDFIYGNLNEKSFKEIWTGERRKEILRKLKTENCREACRADVINRYLDRLKNKELHDNFI